MKIKSIDHLYKESRSLTLSHICFFSDGRVRHALDSKEEREEKWSQKFSSATFVKSRKFDSLSWEIVSIRNFSAS